MQECVLLQFYYLRGEYGGKSQSYHHSHQYEMWQLGMMESILGNCSAISRNSILIEIMKRKCYNLKYRSEVEE